MQVGDLVIRRVRGVAEWMRKPAIEQRETLGHGIVLQKNMAGNPEHPCVTVYYPKTGEIYDIAESLVEVISESNKR